MGVRSITGHSKGIDEACGEDMLAEAVGSALSVEAWEYQPNGGEIVIAVAGAAECVEKLAEFGALDRRGFALLNPVEKADHHTKLRFGHCRPGRWKRVKEGTIVLLFMSDVQAVTASVY